MKKDGTTSPPHACAWTPPRLPKLFAVNVLTGKDWELDSEWYRW